MERQLDPLERARMVRDGLIDRWPAVCEECGRLIQPGASVLCDDGYERIYGEYVLSPASDLYEDNWPVAHAECARGRP
jgi:hypothetical protein